MKKIVKGEPPADFAKFVAKENPQHWEDIHKTKAYPKLYAECVSQLKFEQDNLGGYTEKPLSGRVHIDHYRKRSLFPAQGYVFSWNNLIADEYNMSFGAVYKDNSIQKIDDYERLIDPIAQDPHHFFTYTEYGRIKPKENLDDEEKMKAEFTIRTFNLQHPLLCDDRREIVELVKAYHKGGLSAEEVKGLVSNLGYPSAVDYALTLYS